MTLKARLLASLVMILLAVPAFAGLSPSEQKRLQQAVDGDHRSQENRERDRYRHPLKTLSFFDVKPDMRVVEILPGGGWYTEILAPYLSDEGQLIEATVPATSENPFFRKMAKRYQTKLDQEPKIYGKVRSEPFEPPAYLALGAPGSADRVLSFRNLHDMVFVNPHGEATDAITQRFFRSAFQVLKPGGVLGIVAHRGAEDVSVGKNDQLGRLPQAFVIEQAKRAGFELVASSEINANPRDNHELPIWFLPPSLKNGETDRAKYEAIGEGDNMTLKFIKR